VSSFESRIKASAGLEGFDHIFLLPSGRDAARFVRSAGWRAGERDRERKEPKRGTKGRKTRANERKQVVCVRFYITFYDSLWSQLLSPAVIVFFFSLASYFPFLHSAPVIFTLLIAHFLGLLSLACT